LTQGNPIVQAIIAGSRQRGLDPRAVLSVARTEGGLINRPGDIGDLAGGGSYGPWQLYAQGALPARFRGNPTAADAWAWSPAGISYALDSIAKVARDLQGRQAIEAIVHRFERPADPSGQIAKAQGFYGSSTVGGPVTAQPSAPSPTGFTADALAQSIFAQNNELLGLPSLPILEPLPMPRQPIKGGAPGPPRTRPPAGSSSLSFLKRFVAPFGVTVTSTTGGKHVKGSYHYKARAVDVSGSPEQMLAAARAALRDPTQFREVFYDPLGVYVKNGRVYRGAIGGHSDHVHIAR
jgi:hypothetical protein